MQQENISLEPLKLALQLLKRSIDQPKNEFIRDSVIQRFEYSFELSWKVLKRYFFHNQALDESNVKNLFREGGKQGLIDSVEDWLGFHSSRNLTPHTYNEKTAEEVYEAACKFYPAALALLERLEKLLA